MRWKLGNAPSLWNICFLYHTQTYVLFQEGILLGQAVLAWEQFPSERKDDAQ
jgi:hypothetical protein